MSRRVTIGIFAVMLVAVLASAAVASDATEASASMGTVTNTAAAWASGLLLFGFVTFIIGLFLAARTDINVKAILAIPIICIMIGALLKAGPVFLSPYTAQGATVQETTRP